MILRIKEFNCSHMLINSINFNFEPCFDRNTKYRSIGKLLDFLIMWYTGKKTIFSNCLIVEFSTKTWVISKDDTSILFYETISDILDALQFKELLK